MILKLNIECSNKLYMKGIIMYKFCVKCNAKMTDDAKFCTECGAEQPVVNKCKKCGNLLDENTAFCTNCGTPVAVVNGVKSINTAIKGRYQVKEIKPVVWIGIALAIIAIVAGFIFFSNSSGVTKEPIKASAIVEDYIRDQASAEKTYKDKTIKVTGKLLSKSQFSDSSNYALVIYHETAGGKYYSLSVNIPADKAGEVNKVKEGDFISVEGTCVGVVKQKSPTDISIQIQANKINEN